MSLFGRVGPAGGWTPGEAEGYRHLLKDQLLLADVDPSSSASLDGVHVLVDGRLDALPNLLHSLDLSAGTAAPVAVLHAWMRWGDDFADHLLGDFAVALWDSRSRRLVLARDMAGYRPLFYCQAGSAFFFASTCEVLLRACGLPQSVDAQHVAGWLGLKLGSSSSTFFEGVQTIRPGHVVTWQAGRLTDRDFWRPERVPMLRLRDPMEYAEGLRTLLKQAVHDRLPADGRVASQLSGGLDSSTVTALAAECLQESGGSVVAMTAVPAHSTVEQAGRFSDEGPYAAMVAAQYPNVEHALISNDSLPLLAVLDRMNAAMGAPQFNPPNTIWLYAMAKETHRRGLQGMLTGTQGNMTVSYSGERAIAGLLRRGAFIRARQLARRTTGRSRKGIAADAILPLLPHRWASTMRRWHGAKRVTPLQINAVRLPFLEAHGIDPTRRFQDLWGSDSRAIRLALLRSADIGSNVAAGRNLFGFLKTDPTADRRVVEFCLSVPEEIFCHTGTRRGLLRTSMQGRLPDKVLHEEQRGLQSADFAHQLFRERDALRALLAEMQEIPLLQEALDLPTLQSLMDNLHSPETAMRDWSGYVIRMPRAISLGRFVTRLQQGTLWTANTV
jgi:asparagine synthase (glutamine-hydrolysing)